MNLAFELSKDNPLTKDGLQPYKIVSLWDMLRLKAAKFLSICSTISQINGYVQSCKEQDQKDWKITLDPVFNKNCRHLHRTVAKMNLKASTASTKRLIQFLESSDSGTIYELEKLTNPIMDCIVDELAADFWLAIPFNRKRFYKKRGTVLGGNIIQQFPELQDDALEVGNCFALGRYTGCVFHLMRIMEYMVHQFAAKVGVSCDPENDSWGPILNRITTEIGNNQTKFPPRSSKKKQYSACCKAMDGLRPRRNGIMHRGQDYSEERAMDVIGAVKSCLEQYSELPD